MQYPHSPWSGAKSEASLALLPFALRPPSGTVSLNSFYPLLCSGECGWLFLIFSQLSVSLLGKVAGNRFLLHHWLRSPGQGRQDPHKNLLFRHIVIGQRSWWQFFKSQIVLFGLCKSLSRLFKCETWEQRTFTERYENVTGSVLPKEENSNPKKKRVNMNLYFWRMWNNGVCLIAFLYKT